MSPEPFVRLGGAALICVAVMHVFLGRWLDWRRDAAQLTLVNRQIFYVHCFFIAFGVAMNGVLALAFAPLLVEPSALARLLLAGMTLGWTIRLLFQLFVYSPDLWRGNRTRSALHALAGGLWLYLAAVFGWTLVRQL
jgi:hypothetical protein